MQTWNKREFLQLSTAFGVAAVGFACGANTSLSDASAPSLTEDGANNDNCRQQDPHIVISANHGHLLEVPHTDVLNAVTQVYNIQGTALHTHEVTVTAEAFARLAQGETVVVSSSDSAFHVHQITVRCLG